MTVTQMEPTQEERRVFQARAGDSPPADPAAAARGAAGAAAASLPARARGMSKLWIPPPPRSPARARLARELFARAVRGLDRLEVIAPDGRPLRAQPGAPRMEITSDAFFHRLASAGKIGFGEAYMAEEWRADDLAGVLAAFASRLTSLVPRPMQLVRRLYEPLQPGDERNTTEGARANISRHYDLSNDLFALFLDATMTYSCAIFRPGDSLEQAQLRKYQAMCDLVDLRPDDHLLEIGTGWGGMAMYAAAGSGCRVTTITISERQKQLAERRIREAGLGRQVEVRLCDYRDVRGRFDKIVSIEMFEAVGEEYWAEFFGICDRLLAPGGRMGLQTITMPHNRFRASRRSYTWVHKYIFPGGLIPSEPAIADALQRGSRLRVAFTDEIGDHYARTLRIWRERFLERWDDVRELGFDDTFRRTWEFYLAYCEAGFRTGAIGDVQMALQKQ